MPDSFSEAPDLTDEEREMVRAMRVDNERLHANRDHREYTLAPEKQDFPIGIRPDGTVNTVTSAGAEDPPDGHAAGPDGGTG